MKRASIAVAALAIAGLMPVPSHAATIQIFMSNFAFCSTPVCAGNQNITIARGDIVQFVFADPACLALHAVGCYHTAQTSSAPQAFNSGAMPGPAGSFGIPNPKVLFEKTFTVAGNYNYFCVVHAASTPIGGTMRAVITVT